METIKSSDDVGLLGRITEAHARIREQLGHVIVGQEKVINQMLIALFARGHCVLVGVPGLAKTLLISSLSRILDMSFRRIQFTPDLMPSDITGTEVLQEDKNSRERIFRFMPGPVFANIILADEINRTPPKTQSALLEAMQEGKVTVTGQTYDLPQPFFVLATQNPIEQEGTYPLPEAQLDRFLFQISIVYPEKEDEKNIALRTTSGYVPHLEPVLDVKEIMALQEMVRRVPVSDSVVELVVNLVRSSRPKENDAPDFIRKWITWGAGPRATQALILSGKAKAVLGGRATVSGDDIKELAYPVLRHRLILSFQAEADGVTTDEVITKLLEIC